MKNLTYIIIYLLFTCKGTYGQINLVDVDSLNIKRAKIIADTILKSEAVSSDYIILVINMKFLLVQKQRLHYNIFRGSYGFNIKDQKDEILNLENEILSADEILDQSFREDVCSPPFMYVGGDTKLIEASKWGPAYYYFALFNKEKKRYEISLPLTQPMKAEQSSSFPINHKVIKHLVKLMRLFPY